MPHHLESTEFKSELIILIAIKKHTSPVDASMQLQSAEAIKQILYQDLCYFS